MKIDEYLSSNKARADVADLLDIYQVARPDAPAIRVIGAGGATMVIHACDAWSRVSYRAGWSSDALMTAAYFRPEGDRFIVSDLGESVRALRLRTGADPTAAERAASDVLLAMLRNAPRWWVPNTCRAGAIEIPQGALAAELPVAICCVMLAAYRVCQLSLPQQPAQEAS